MKHRLNDKEKKALVRLYEAGVSPTEICKNNSIARSTLYSWVKKFDKKKNVQANFKLNQQLNKLHQKIEVLQLVDCNVNSPLKERLGELEKLSNKYSVHILCEALKVNRGTYYDHILRRKKDDSYYLKHKILITKQVIEVFHETNQILGAEKITAIIRGKGFKTCTSYVAKIMQENNLYSIRKNSKKLYNKLEPKENKIKGVFNVNAPNKVWGSDTSYLKI